MTYKRTFTTNISVLYLPSNPIVIPTVLARYSISKSRPIFVLGSLPQDIFRQEQSHSCDIRRSRLGSTHFVEPSPCWIAWKKPPDFISRPGYGTPCCHQIGQGYLDCAFGPNGVFLSLFKSKPVESILYFPGPS